MLHNVVYPMFLWLVLQLPLGDNWTLNLNSTETACCKHEYSLTLWPPKGHYSYLRRSYWHTCVPDRSHILPRCPHLTFPPLLFTYSQCEWGEVRTDPLRVRQLLWFCEELPAHAGGGGLQPGDVRLSIWQAELQSYFPQLASLRCVQGLWCAGLLAHWIPVKHLYIYRTGVFTPAVPNLNTSARSSAYTFLHQLIC